MGTYRLTGSYINGEWLESGALLEVTNKASGQVITSVHEAGRADGEAAVIAASKAFTTWKVTTSAYRSELLMRWHALIVENVDSLAVLLSKEQGKPLAEAKGEIMYGANYIVWFAEEAKRIYGATIPALSPSQRIVVTKHPVGVVAAITPWNFPNAMITRKAAAALAAGCTFVVRPSELTPLSALALADLADQAGIPKGVFNVVVGSDAQGIGEVLTQHPLVNKFSFTGSTRVGKLLAAQCASTVKKVSLELGGNAPFIVFDDADIDAAIEGAMLSKFRNAGQTCVCTNRFFVHRSVATEFTQKLADRVAQLKVGNGLMEGVSIGPLISSSAVGQMQVLVDDALAHGATCVVGGQSDEQTGQFYKPTVLTGVTNKMRVAQSEIFGPIAPIILFDDEADVLAMANDTPYGLASYVYTRDIGRVWRMGESLEYGMVGINEGVISNPSAPFGGVKESGYGREGSRYGLDDYTETKYMCIGGI